MANFLRIGDTSIPTAAQAKSMGIPVEELKERIQQYEEALRQNDASCHKIRRFKEEKVRYHRLIRRLNEKDLEENPEAWGSALAYVYYRIFGGYAHD